MFPLVSGMREKARGSVCAENLKQIGIGLQTFIAEYMKFANDPKRGGPYNFVRGNW